MKDKILSFNVVQKQTVKKLNKKVVAITGAASGIGKELAMQLASQGAFLALNDWNKDDLLEVTETLQSSGANVLSIPFDVSDRKSWESFADKIISHFGHLDILINNAGVTHFNTPVEEIEVETFSRIIDINMWGTIHGIQVMLPLLKERNEASIVNLSSSLGLVGYPNLAAYVMSKFAIRGLSETLQLEYKDDKSMHIMSVHPGGVRTNFTRNIKHHSPSHLNKLINLFDKHAMSSASDTAHKIIRGINKKKKRVLVGKDAWYMDLVSRLFPQAHHSMLPPAFDPTKITTEEESHSDDSSITVVKTLS